MVHRLPTIDLLFLLLVFGLFNFALLLLNDLIFIFTSPPQFLNSFPLYLFPILALFDHQVDEVLHQVDALDGQFGLFLIHQIDG